MRRFPRLLAAMIALGILGWIALPAAPVLGHGADLDDDGVPNLLDNCLFVPNPAHTEATDCSGDGDATDPGEGFGQQCDRDGDGVGDACDNCVEAYNPRPGDPAFPGNALPAESFQTLTGDQLDDDADGYGNACDGDFNQSGLVIGGPDTTELSASIGEEVAGDTCGVSGDMPCAIFDIDGVGDVIGGADTTLYGAMAGMALVDAGNVARIAAMRDSAAADMKCPSCPLTCEAGVDGDCSP